MFFSWKALIQVSTSLLLFQPSHTSKMPFLTLRDGAQLYYKDWNPKVNATTVVFSHGWPLSSDGWEKQMLFLASHGYRVVAHDRRGHGRSEQTWERNDVNNWADDLSELIEKLDLKEIMLVGHSTGGAEAAKYCGRRKSLLPKPWHPCELDLLIFV